jgi:hypothetical protein
MTQDDVISKGLNVWPPSNFLRPGITWIWYSLSCVYLDELQSILYNDEYLWNLEIRT